MVVMAWKLHREDQAMTAFRHTACAALAKIGEFYGRNAYHCPGHSTKVFCMPNRTVFYVSDGTGITAETFGHSILAQFSAKPRHVRRPFIDSVDKAHKIVTEINAVAATEGVAPSSSSRWRGWTCAASSPATSARVW
jgi:hypothetical protein